MTTLEFDELFYLSTPRRIDFGVTIIENKTEAYVLSGFDNKIPTQKVINEVIIRIKIPSQILNSLTKENFSKVVVPYQSEAFAILSLLNIDKEASLTSTFDVPGFEGRYVSELNDGNYEIRLYTKVE